MIVADTNLLAYLLIEGEHTEAARRVRAIDDGWIQPALWRSEFLNVLNLAVKTHLLDEAEAMRVWRSALAVFGSSEYEPEGADVLRVAIRRDISAYDAQFVTTALDLGLRLVTFDRRILKSSPDVAMTASDFVAGS